MFSFYKTQKNFNCILLQKIIKFNNGKKFLIKGLICWFTNNHILNNYRFYFNNKDDDEYIYRKEDLLDLIKDKNSPWYINYDWSNEANKIRELYISEINSINLNDIEQYFKTLRLIDRNVSLFFYLIYFLSYYLIFYFKIKDIDKGISKFVNLNELIVSVNWIENCNSKYLPQSLKASFFILINSDSILLIN